MEPKNNNVSLKEYFEKEIENLKALLTERDKQFNIIQEYNNKLEIKAETAVQLALKQADQRMNDHNNVLEKMETQAKTFPNNTVFGLLSDKVDKHDTRLTSKENDKTVIVALILSVGSVVAALIAVFLK